MVEPSMTVLPPSPPPGYEWRPCAPADAAALRALIAACDRAPLFYEACVDAFSDRPGPMWTQDEWVTGDP